MGSTFSKAQNRLSSAKHLEKSLSWPEVKGSLEVRKLPISHVGRPPRPLLRVQEPIRLLLWWP